MDIPTEFDTFCTLIMIRVGSEKGQKRPKEKTYFKKKLGRITKNTTCKSIVVYSNVGSRVQLGRMTKIMATMTQFPPMIVSQIVGHMLGDGSLVYSYTSNFPYFVFTQTIKRFEYIWAVFTQLAHYCNSVPVFNKGFRKGAPYPFIQVITRSYPFLATLHRLFYVKIKGHWVKVVTYDLLPYLTPAAIAYWAIDDGAATTSRSGFYLHTKGFTYEDVYKLVGMLHYLYDLNCTVQNHEGKPVIYIRADSMPLFVSLVRPYFYPIMMYKLVDNL